MIYLVYEILGNYNKRKIVQHLNLRKNDTISLVKFKTHQLIVVYSWNQLAIGSPGISKNRNFCMVR